MATKLNVRSVNAVCLLTSAISSIFFEQLAGNAGLLPLVAISTNDTNYVLGLPDLADLGHPEETVPTDSAWTKGHQRLDKSANPMVVRACCFC